jgi:hypothetical protein
MRTVWVLGDQLNRSIGALAEADLATDRVLMLSEETWSREKGVVTQDRPTSSLEPRWRNDFRLRFLARQITYSSASVSVELLGAAKP